ncbi:hypothetical protein EDB92DRAFT_617748 [Lactarius akahatsu]|uniref:Uncharacterized protein n=1 Tax=Lactarius akahatsu TaxID=416441 RepID=A0AAD4QDT2_9AGAM|nr:hypothetical protein EDB92DRAFT_617748 [Lactarius akahatsu]
MASPSFTRNLVRTLHTSTLDRFVLDALSVTPSVERPDLTQLIRQYLTHSGKVLGTQLAYESRPSSSRRVSFKNNRDIHLVAHVAREGDRNNITLSSGFAIDASDGQSIVVTCAHTLEEIRWSPLLVLPDVPHPSPLTSPPDLSHVRSSGSFVFSQRGPESVTYPVASILSSLHRSDLILLSPFPLGSPLRSLPISPYPAPMGTPIRAHFVSEKRPEEDGWQPWIGSTWSKWVRGTVLGYRDFSGREASPGTYDALSHMFFHPLPTPGSSGGPIVDENSGAVVGVMLGSRMDSFRRGNARVGCPC